MIPTFNNDIISDYHKKIRRLLYKADGRNLKLPEDLFDFNNGNTNDLMSHNTDPNENSKIKLYPNRSHLECLSNPLEGKALEYENKYFRNDFLKFPVSTIKSSKDVKINYYFYVYTTETEQSGEDIESTIIDNYSMLRPEFLYQKIVSKYRYMVCHYQAFISYAKIDFQFANNTKEEFILQHLIIYYNNILKIDNNQLSVFRHIQLSKQIADLYLKIVIEFLTIRLNLLSPEFEKYYIGPPENKKTERKIDEKKVYELPENFSLRDLNIKSKALDIRQTAVLFHYLKEHKAVIEYDDTSYSKLVHYLSGHSMQNLRRNSGFGNIWKIKGESRNGISYSTLKSVRGLLENIIEDINNEIKD